MTSLEGSDAGAPRWLNTAGIDGVHSKGDSGGPLFCGGQLAGIVSCTPNRDLSVCSTVKVFATISSARDFVTAGLAAWSAGSADAGSADGGRRLGDAAAPGELDADAGAR